MTDAHRQPGVLIFGAGAVGTLLGGLLAGAGYRVTLLGRGESITSIQQSGLEIQLHDRRFRTSPTAASSFTDLSGPFDVILLTVRTFAVERALESLPELIASDGVLVSIQNGIGTEALIQRALPGNHQVAASLTLSADAAAPGMASSSSRSGGIAFASVSTGAPVEQIAGMFRKAGIPVAIAGDYRSMKWSKLLINQMANGIPAILDWTPGQLYRHPGAFRVEQAMLRETMRVISADGAKLISLPGFPVPLLKWVLQLPDWIARRLLLRRVEDGRGDKLPSLLLDLQAGRSRLEADWLYGAVARAGDQAGVPAPVNRRINRILNSIAESRELRSSFRDSPDRLIRNVALALRESRTEGSSAGSR